MAPPPPMGSMASQLHRNTYGMIDIVVESSLVLICILTLDLRLKSRKLQRSRLQINDWLIIVATPLMIARYVLEMILVIRCGLGLHWSEVLETAGPAIMPYLQKLVYAGNLLWVTLVTLIKLSILHFYMTIFCQPIFLRAAQCMLVLCGAYWVAAFFSTAFICTPVQKSWSPDIPGKCGNASSMYSGCASTDLIIDVIVILLPMPVLWSLQLPKAKKIALTCIFGLGFLIIALTAIRVKYMVELDITDFTFSAKEMAILAALVPLLGIINANLPVMAPALNKIFRTSSMATTIKTSLKSGSNNPTSRNFEILADPELPLVQVNSAVPPAGTLLPVHQKTGCQVDKIQITTEWEIRSDNAEQHRY